MFMNRHTEAVSVSVGKHGILFCQEVLWPEEEASEVGEPVGLLIHKACAPNTRILAVHKADTKTIDQGVKSYRAKGAIGITVLFAK